ncbi:uncharacterized protein A4U43_C08F13740 [Asparagus officinalis]|nr:uncharacterized protein A4U43_C08F13740 [Asparagus officinalis]
MGIRLPPRRAKEAELGGDGTLVLVSVNVTRRKRRLKLDGIVRTVITLGCNRWGTQKPAILENSVTMLSNAELRMAMFSLGLFMALQPRITCGKKHATIGTLIRFITGPAVIALASVAVVIRGKPIRVSIVQRIINKSGLKTEEQKAMVAEMVVVKAMEVVEQAEWWGRVRPERAEEAARDFKRRRYALLDYVESLKQGMYYRNALTGGLITSLMMTMTRPLRFMAK